jgi:cell division topological specificity factor
MFENIMNFFKKLGKKESKQVNNSKDAAKERLHLVLMQDRANVSADFLELMKQEIIEVIKKYIDVDEREIDVRLTNKENGDGTNGAPALYANIPILNIKSDSRKVEVKKEENKNKNDSEEQDKSDKKNEADKEEEVKKVTSKQKIDKEKINEDEKKENNTNTEKNPEKKENKSTKTKEKIKSEN